MSAGTGTRLRRALLLGIAVCCAPQVLPAQSRWKPLDSHAKSSFPAHLEALARLPPGSVSLLQRSASKSGGGWRVPVADGAEYSVEASPPTRHASGDVSYSGSLRGESAAFTAFITEGPEAAFGLWNTPRGRYRFEAWGDRAWLIRLDHPSIDLLDPDVEVVSSSAVSASGATVHSPQWFDTSKAAAGTQIDVLFLVTAGFEARYPGSARETRVRFLVDLANQIFANSAVDLGLRLVGIDSTTYTDTGDNGTALQLMQRALAGASGVTPAFEGLRARRIAAGADLVTLARPHEIEERGSCGIAYLFGRGETYGLNVLSDGVSSWSICSDETYAHEVGHNLGAEHQPGASSENAGFGQAHVVPGQYHTVMGSFGTGDPNRGLRLQRFSNPQQQCGGLACGEDGASDNARRLRLNMGFVAGYAAPTSSVVAVDVPAALDPDEDGDGVPESEDAFPHDPAHARDGDADGVPDGIDVFPNNPLESFDTDGDGVGDLLDPDIDGDGVGNAIDALPRDASERIDADGDGVGDNADAFDDDRREWGDVDGDGEGDNADVDTDGDLTPDFDPVAQDLLVASVGTDRVVRFDGGSGRFIAIEIAESHAPFALGPKSALAWNPYRRRVDALIASEVRRYDPASRRREARVLRSFRSDGTGLRSGLSAAFAVGRDGNLVVADGSARSLHRFEPVRASETAQGAFGDDSFFPAYPRALYATSRNSVWTLDRNGSLGEVDIATGVFLRQAAPISGATFPTDPTALVEGPEGMLYLADGASDRVLRIDPSNGRFESFVAAGGGGLDHPAGLAFDRGGRLYVSSAGTDRVLRYDANGAFIDVFTRAPVGMLSQPRALVFVPRVIDRFPRDPMHSLRPRSGAWFDPATSGQGIDLQAIPGGLAFAWYTYEEDGRPTWYLAVGPLTSDTWSGVLQRYTWNGEGSVPRDVGSVALQFVAEDRALLRWQLDGRSGEQTIEHLQTGASIETQFPTAVWYAPATPGWGYSITRQGDVLAIASFAFDRDGEPTWALAVGDANATALSLQRPRAPNACPGCTGNTSPVFSDAGSVRFETIDAERATGSIDFVDADVEWRFDSLELGRLSDSPTRPGGDPLP